MCHKVCVCLKLAGRVITFQSNVKYNYLNVLNKHTVWSVQANIRGVICNSPCVKDPNMKSKLKYSSQNTESPLRTTVHNIAEQDFSVCTLKCEWNLSGSNHHACLELWAQENKILKTWSLYPEDTGLLQNFSFLRSSKFISLFYGLVVYRETSRQRHVVLCRKKDWRRLSKGPQKYSCHR